MMRLTLVTLVIVLSSLTGLGTAKPGWWGTRARQPNNPFQL